MMALNEIIIQPTQTPVSLKALPSKEAELVIIVHAGLDLGGGFRGFEPPHGCYIIFLYKITYTC